jgi:hypothetical protein
MGDDMQNLAQFTLEFQFLRICSAHAYLFLHGRTGGDVSTLNVFNIARYANVKKPSTSFWHPVLILLALNHQRGPGKSLHFGTFDPFLSYIYVCLKRRQAATFCRTKGSSGR